MITFKEAANIFYPLKWVQQSLAFHSVVGIEHLLSSSFCVLPEKLNCEYDKMDKLYHLLESPYGEEFYQKATHNISVFRDIKGSLDRLENGTVLSELELFELKFFAYYYGIFASLLHEYRFDAVETEELSPVFALLDPDHTGVVSFYLYNSYDNELEELRSKIRVDDSNEELYNQLEEVGFRVRTRLSAQLEEFIISIRKALESVACFDLLMAKVLFAKKTGFCRPSFHINGETFYKGLINPYLSDILSSKGEQYQAIDIALSSGPTLIIGANMSGKTMVLKSVALAQYLIQFGFYAPAEEAGVALWDGIIMLIGDSQNEDKGLSSFGGEILAISDMIESIYEGSRHYLILLDEPARTTSPQEGVAIVDAVIELLSEQKAMSLITTHYNSLKADCRCLKVRGFVEGLVEETVNCRNINRFIDYRLINAQANENCSEAFEVAKLLGVSNKLLNRIKMKDNV